MNRYRWLNCSAAWLLLLLQRTPAVRLALNAAEFTAPSRIVALLQSAFTASVSLGAIHSLAGATVLVATQTTPARVTVGTSVQIGMTVTGAQTAPASWTVSGSVPPGLSFSGKTSGIVNISTLLLTGTPTTAGTYQMSLLAWEKINGLGDRSSIFPYTVIVSGAAATGPTLTAQPASQSATAGSTVTFSVTATGSPAPAYQWRKDGANIPGATNAQLSLPNVQAADAGSYSVVVSNAAATVFSAAAVLTVVSTAGPPAITAQPAAQYMSAGASVTLTVAASGPGVNYQWKKAGVDIAGATNATYTIANASASAMGFYSVTASNASGAVDSNVAIVTVATGGRSRLTNVSTRGFVSPGAALTPGFVLQGTGSKPLVIRAVGPTLDSFGVGGALADPMLDVIPLGGTNAIASNDNWGGSTEFMRAFSIVGAFPMAAAASKDSTVVGSFAATGASGYTVRITSSSTAAAGIVLAEVYDEDPLTAPVRLVNVSTIGFVGAGDQALVPGFFIAGDAPKQLLIRAVGPGLGQFGVTGVLADPQLSVVPLGGSSAIAASDNWGGTATLQAAFTQAGAFTLPTDSSDAAVLVRLPPGGYTVVVSGVASTTGTALVEVYDLDP